ncbi:hypothetical protein E2I00_013912 [Balaenoptera physalus]|uniref:Uncharacterized protein n=1 Tax=Balaenoptera physalus TaxID=9770 RepID=A0A643CG75_BALPH|nr:hypothetical protein E2I00_013912 [Balaenoptera physalus]
MKSFDILVFDEAERLLDMQFEGTDLSQPLRTQEWRIWDLLWTSVKGAAANSIGDRHPRTVSPLQSGMCGRREDNLMVHFLQNQNQLVGILWKDPGVPGKVVKKLQSGILKFTGVVAQKIAIPEEESYIRLPKMLELRGKLSEGFMFMKMIQLPFKDKTGQKQRQKLLE